MTQTTTALSSAEHIYMLYFPSLW